MDGVDSKMVFRVSMALKEDFEATCDRLGTVPSVVLRDAMARYVLDNDPRQQRFLTLAGREKLDEPVGEDPIVTDSITGMQYYRDDPESVLQAKMTRLSYKLFEKRHPEMPLRSYQELESVKRAAWAIADDRAQPPQARADAFEAVMQALFSRSVDRVLARFTHDAHLLHPGWNEYARHYLTAIQAEEEKRIGAEAMALLRQKYRPVKQPRILPGDSYWRHG